jgi:hypothetical protein
MSNKCIYRVVAVPKCMRHSDLLTIIIPQSPTSSTTPKRSQTPTLDGSISQSPSTYPNSDETIEFEIDTQSTGFPTVETGNESGTDEEFDESDPVEEISGRCLVSGDMLRNSFDDEFVLTYPYTSSCYRLRHMLTSYPWCALNVLFVAAAVFTLISFVLVVTSPPPSD